MAQYIDKAALVAEIERRKIIAREKTKIAHDNNNVPVTAFWSGKENICNELLSFLDTLEVKDVDLDESAKHYLLHEHVSPLNEVLHQADLKVEMQYHKDIEDAYKAGFELGLKARTNKYLVEEVYSHIDSIKDTADRMTSGNFMHNRAAIKFSANTIAKVLELMGLKAQKGEEK